MTTLKGDQAPWLVDPYQSEEQHRGIKRTSRYLTMRDGVRIAIDLYLPKDLESGNELPAVIHQTRYYRRFVYNRLLRGYMLRRDNTWQETKRFVENGYAAVHVDVRGTGASFGSRQMEFSPDEIKDSAEIVEWIVEQPWSNGSVGSIGTSYTGTTAELLLTNNHPAVRVAVVRYANFDSYTDIVSPGGARNIGFLKTWALFNDALDNDRLSKFLRKHVGRMAGIAVKGMAPVDDDRGRKLLKEAVKEHAQNYDIYETSNQVEFSDDSSDDGLGLDQISPYRKLDLIEGCGVPIYSWSSWYDGGFTQSAIKRYLNVSTPGCRLILGPWDHGGRQNPDPHSPGQETYFDHTGEVLRFFDFYLKGTQTGIDADPPVRYFTMGEEAWKSSDTWPPSGFNQVPFYFNQSRELIPEQRPKEAGYSIYQMDYTTSTGKASRWVSLVNVGEVGIGYPDRAQQDEKLLVYQTASIKQDAEVTGSPEVTLYVRSSAEDAQFFVYLEEVTENGDVIYVTEGQFRAIHRLVKDDSPYEYPQVYHSYKSEDARPLVPGDTARISFNLLPVSYLFRKGNKIRIAIAGADRDNFTLVPEEPPTVEILWGQEHPSQVLFPLKWR